MKNQYKMFVFGETLKKAIDQIPETEKLRFYQIIVEYGIDGIEPELNGFEAAVWVQMKDMIDNTMPQKRGAPTGNDNAKKEKQIKQFELIDSIENNKSNANELNQINQSENIETNAPMYNVNVNENENVNEKEKENGLSLSPFIKIPESPGEKNYVMIFEEVKAKWKEITGQETKETLFQISSTKREKFINTLAIYSLDDIFNAIGNYHLARDHPEDFDIGGRIYGSLTGFLENGVSQFFEDGTAEKNFRRREK
jgi:hypothetical protein